VWASIRPFLSTQNGKKKGIPIVGGHLLELGGGVYCQKTKNRHPNVP
jgi:hypothetical protein